MVSSPSGSLVEAITGRRKPRSLRDELYEALQELSEAEVVP
jgi:hypothetical protein